MPNEYVMKISVFSRNIIMGALWKSLLATILFMLFYFLYSIEIVRSNVEDVAFDTVNKFSIHKHPVETNSSQVFLFAFDDLYMKEHQLFDEDNRSNYGYLFPRDHIAQFIEDLDELISELSTEQYPKALFIDYDMSFTAMPYGKILAEEDRKLLEVLKRVRPYEILLPKTEQANFIERSDDKDIQKAIKEHRIRMVSVPLLQSRDDVVRRYQSFQSFGETHPSKSYIGVSAALWQILRGERIDVNVIQDTFKKKDIIANRIFLKSYDDGIIDEEGCLIQYSQWQQLRKYSTLCSLFEIDYDDFAGSVVMLGGTHSQNDDKFSVLSVLRAQTFSGIDIHANALMTMLHLDASLKRFPLWSSMIVIFISFFLLDSLVSFIFYKLHLDNEKLAFMTLLIFSTILLILLSVYLLRAHHLWFNWFVPLILFQLLELLLLFRKHSPLVILKIIQKLRK